DPGVSAGLTWLGRWMQTQHGLAVELHVDDNVVVEREDIRIVLFQSIRELLFNVIKHAGVAEAKVEVSMSGEKLVETIVSDRGTGFDPAGALRLDAHQIGFGLFSIRERLELLGGKFDIEST